MFSEDKGSSRSLGPALTAIEINGTLSIDFSGNEIGSLLVPHCIRPNVTTVVVEQAADQMGG